MDAESPPPTNLSLGQSLSTAYSSPHCCCMCDMQIPNGVATEFGKSLVANRSDRLDLTAIAPGIGVTPKSWIQRGVLVSTLLIISTCATWAIMKNFVLGFFGFPGNVRSTCSRCCSARLLLLAIDVWHPRYAAIVPRVQCLGMVAGNKFGTYASWSIMKNFVLVFSHSPPRKPSHTRLAVVRHVFFAVDRRQAWG